MNEPNEPHYLQSEAYRQTWIERYDGPVYDTLYLPVPPIPDNALQPDRRMRAFDVPLGQIVTPWGGTTRIKDLNDTNMFECRMLPRPNEMFVENITAMFQRDGVVIPFTNPWYHRSIFRFYLNQKLYAEGHLDTIAAPPAYFVDEMERKDAIRRNLYKLLDRKWNTPLLIEQQEAFLVEIEFPPDLAWRGVPETLRIYLNGFRYRAIQ